MTWKHWALAAVGVFVLSIDGWGCAGKADTQQNTCSPNEMQADGANGFGWIHWDDAALGPRHTQCFYSAPSGAQWAGGSSQNAAEPILCWMSNGGQEGRLQVFDGMLLFIDALGQTQQLGTCR